MSEYERLIENLNLIIESINKKIETIEEENNKQKEVKQVLAKVIEQIDNKKITDIDVEELEKVLKNIISEPETSKISWIKTKLIEISKLQAFLFDESFTNPLKKVILEDLKNIKISLQSINDELVPKEITPEELRVKEQCQKYLKIVSKKGYVKILPEEERLKFYEFVKALQGIDGLRLITDYIIFVNKSKKQFELNTSNKAIEIVNKNALEVIKELEEKGRQEEKPKETKPKVEKIDTGMSPVEKTKNVDFEKVYERILEILEQNKDKTNSATYEIYTKLFADTDIYKIYEKISDFSTAEGINWDMVIPCIKEKLIPNINSDSQLIILKIFNEIIKLYDAWLLRQQEIEEENKKYKEKLLKFKKEFDNIKSKYEELKNKIQEMINDINLKTQNNKEFIMLLLNIIKDEKLSEEEKKANLKPYNLTIEELKLYELNNSIVENMESIDELIKYERLSEDDFSCIYEILKEIKERIESCDKLYQEIEGTLTKTPSPRAKKQFETGESIIVFFRESEEDKFLIENDLDRQLVDKESYSDISQILKKTNDMTHEKWSTTITDPNHFKVYISYTKKNGKRGDIITITSDYSQKEYKLFRLKDKGKTNPRIFSIDIEMCDENRQKLGIPSGKHIILMIGEKQVMKYSNEAAEYSDIRQEVKKYESTIKMAIELFENPDTDEEILYKLLSDSNDLYVKLTGRGSEEQVL